MSARNLPRGFFALIGVTMLAAVLVAAALTRDYGTAASADYTYTPTEREERPRVAFLGDSYTAGTGASKASARWSATVSREREWRELNFGLGSASYGVKGHDDLTYAERVPDVVAAEPDVVIVSGGRNGYWTEQGDAIAATFTGLRESLPEADIIALSPFWDSTAYPPELTALGETVRANVEAAGGRYVDIGHPLEGKPDTITEDGIHPNDTGYAALAEAVNAALG